MWKNRKVKEEHDACGIVSVIEKNGTPTHDNIQKTFDALIKMSHRAGFVDGEGDGCGIQIDIPRKLWAKNLMRNNLPATLSEQPGFAVGHFFLLKEEKAQKENWLPKLREFFQQAGFSVLVSTEANVNSDVLGPQGRHDEPLFVQLALHHDKLQGQELEKQLFQLQCQIEAEMPFHVVSLSSHIAIYKVRGSANILPLYYPDLQSKDCRSVISLGHNRYSTNTTTVFERVQPFSVLGHNGEINTIQKLREEAQMLGIQLVHGGSDSQDMNRTIEGMIHLYGISFFEAMEMIFPPIINEIKQFSNELQDMYMFFRSGWGPFAQGPAGIVSRYGDQCLYSVDALGLRPVWLVETDTSYYFSSEQGVVPVTEMVNDPKAIAPGEKVAVQIDRNAHSATIVPYSEMQQQVLHSAKQRYRFKGFRKTIGFGTPSLEGEFFLPTADPASDAETRDRLLAAFGWDTADLDLVEQQANTGLEPVRSLGFDGPLAALSRERQNIADFFKETVAVVTNPAIDREREIEHFSTRVVLGPRPSLQGHHQHVLRRLEIHTPLLVGGHRNGSPLSIDEYRPMAHELGTYLFEDLIREFNAGPHSIIAIDAVRKAEETVKDAVHRIERNAVEAVVAGAHLLVIDDRHVFRYDNGYVDPMLVVSAVHHALKEYPTASGAENLRRRTSIVLRSGALRNLHDISVAIGLGADAVNPYMMWETAGLVEPQESIKKLYQALHKGLEKVISTLGIHELRGYDRLFSSIGLKPEVQKVLQTVNFYGSEQAGFGWDQLQSDSEERSRIASGEETKKMAKTFHYFPRIWKLAGDVAAGNKPFSDLADKMVEMETNNPISLRHVLDLKNDPTSKVEPKDTDISIGEHSLPFLISSMSFGSQNETAYRAYAEAAYRLNMISLNGEGGEIKDLIGKYPNHRGMQIASGRFGVNIELTNSSNLLEIKIGQGAKPGEGGHLPSSKVTAKIAAARNAQPGTDLISPSNNHDIYSIEDLAQMIDELKTANPKARVSVKVPVVPNIGTIAVGIAKAGADIITLSGYDGGTGAARAHALKYVGLPVEIGVKLAHRELVESGLRNKVEIWADGGVKTGFDVMKLILLGANRVGFGTMAMVAIGCISCRACHKDTCPVGIATQMESIEEAKEKGLKMFKPREFDLAVEHLMGYFKGVGEHVRQLTAKLGVARLQDLVGQSDLLEQTRELDRLDLSDLLAPVQSQAPIRGAVPELRVSSVGVNSLTERLAMETVMEVAAGSDTVTRQAGTTLASDRVIGSYLSGSVTRGKKQGEISSFNKAKVNFDNGSVGGNGFAAYNTTGVHIRIQGGAQDGVGKTSLGGKVIVLKGKNKYGKFVDGSVGKGLAYGAQRGLFIVQGNADSRAGIRLSGADIVIGGQLQAPVEDSRGMIGSRANIKGFAFEYMTNGRAVVLGDPGPWICSGMTGGVIYLRVQPEMGLDENALRRRIAKGAKVALSKLDPQGKRDLEELIGNYVKELRRSGQEEEANQVEALLAHPEQHFMMVKPASAQTDQDIATE
ncbi:glutamate synthase-related protein [Effusibacillus dendaii]|nr:glutamate synthase-related protein [Effusibacillus dendaii]